MKNKDIVSKMIFMEKMGHLLDAGVSLFESLKILQNEINNSKTRKAISRLIEGIEKQGQEFKMEEWLDKKYFTESEIIIITRGIQARRPDRSFLTIAQWLEKEQLANQSV